MLIVGWEGERESVERRRELSSGECCAAAAPSRSAPRPGSSWEHGRYEGPHLRDPLIDGGVLVETLETSHTYARIGELYDGVRTALTGAIDGRGPRRGSSCATSPTPTATAPRSTSRS